ncbi:MAG TPA: helix-turn-helix transcriptional regulator [Clostridiales bacterium]|nr:helix-turn-helix transcriptional regulator [Clostridiales bacterium]
MQAKNFGELIKTLRIDNSFTQIDLANLTGYSIKQISRIEKGRNIPSIEFLHKLSHAFNIDLNQYFKVFYNYCSIDALEQFNELNSALQANDIHLIKSVYLKYENHRNFQFGEHLQAIYYCKAICQYTLNKDYSLSIQTCIEGLKVEHKNFSLDKIKTYIFSNTSYSILNILSCNYLAIKENKIAQEILMDLCTNLELHIINTDYPLYNPSDYHKKIYQASLHNISNLYIEHNDFQEAYNYADKGINFSIENNLLRFLPNTYYIKFKASYYLERYDEAYELYNHTIMLYKTTNQMHKAINLKKSLKKDFKNLKNAAR